VPAQEYPAATPDRASRFVSDHKAKSSAVVAPYCASVVVVETFFNCIDFNRRKIVLGCGLLVTSIFLFAGVVWWFVGRIMRWAFYKIARAGT
jgi:hypothetical protein